MAKNKHLTLDDRFIISNLLDQCTSFKAIGIEIGKDCTTVSKEVRNHKVYRQTGALGKGYNSCAKRTNCDHRYLCTNCKSNKCPYDMFKFLYGTEVLELLGCRKIAPNDVTLKPSLLRNNTKDK